VIQRRLGEFLLVPPRVRRAMFRRSLGSVDVLTAVTVPTLVVHGTADAVVAPGAAEYAAGKIPGASLRWFQAVGHVPFAERPDEFNGHFASWWSAVGGRRRELRRRGAAAPPRRVAVLSVHTSPLDQPGTGDAGGMNVYIAETATRMARRGVAVEVFTRATSSDLPPVVELAPGVLVRHVHAGPFEGSAATSCPPSSARSPRACCAPRPARARLLRPGALALLAVRAGGLAGQGALGVPLVHTAHTLARVKNAALAAGDTPEPRTGRSASSRWSTRRTGWWPTPRSRPPAGAALRRPTGQGARRAARCGPRAVPAR
jgi:hypothetical protein